MSQQQILVKNNMSFLFGGKKKEKEEEKKNEDQIEKERQDHARYQRLKKLGGPTPISTQPEQKQTQAEDQILQNADAEMQDVSSPQLSQNVPMVIEEKKPVEKAPVKSQPSSQSTGAQTDEKLFHQLISDAYLITNESKQQSSQDRYSQQQQKTFLYEFCKDGNLFKTDDLDIILFTRLSKQAHENKFLYLYEAYQRIEQHIIAKQKKNFAEKIQEMKNITARYFVTCYRCPDTFELPNDFQEVIDKNDGAFGGAQQNMEEMMQAMMNGQGMFPGMGNPESLSIGARFMFNKMQNDLWEAIQKCAFVHHRDFMASIMLELGDDQESRDEFFETIFNKMHLALPSIKQENFNQAEQNLEFMRALFDHEGAQEQFVKSMHFLNPTMNGNQIQKGSYFGKYLSFSALMWETRTWRQSDLNFQFHKMRPEQHQKYMDQLGTKFYNLHNTLQEIIKKLLKNQNCKERVLAWMRAAVGLNLDKQKMFTHSPVATDGFILNFIDLLLQLCKPFTGNFQKYGGFISKINCFYLSTNKYVQKAADLEMAGSSELVKQYVSSGKLFGAQLSGVTQNPFVEVSSLLGGGDQQNQMSPPNFVTECFFLAHILISFMGKKLEQLYKKNNDDINKSIKEKDYQMFDEHMSYKLCLDAHIFSKNIIVMYRQLFSFTNTLIISSSQVNENLPGYADLFGFLEGAVSDKETELPLDFQALPQMIFHNLNSFPKIFTMIYPESYFAADIDIHTQLACSVQVILNRKIANPHMRIEFVNFMHQIMPQKKVSQHHEKNNRLYKDVFFMNPALRNHLMHALIIVYVDSEKTDYYGKFGYRYAAANVMEYIWSDEVYRTSFKNLPTKFPADFSEFCNLQINDMNSLLFDGLLALEEIKNFEELKEDQGTWNQLDQEQRDQAESNFMDQSRKAKGTLQLSNMVIQLLGKVTKNCQDPFVSEELGEKFAQALNFCLDQLTTQKGLKFKIKDPERFHFEPKELLINIIQMYANMGHIDTFKKNVVSDGRSYSDETFEKAVKILNSSKKNIQVGAEDKEKFEILVVQLKDEKKKVQEEEMVFDDAPEEFLDPLTYAIMEDPVELPDSHTIIDRITIKRHLLNDPHDPFNRAPLTLDQVIPRPDILQKIEDYNQQATGNRETLIEGVAPSQARPAYGEGRDLGQSSDNTIIMRQFGLTKFKQRQKELSDYQSYAEMARQQSLPPGNSSQLYEQLIQNEDNNETDDQISNNKFRQTGQVINNISGIGDFSAITGFNESKMRMKGYGQRQGGAMNLGIAAPLFIPSEMSVIRGAQQNSILGSVKDGASYAQIRGFGGTSSIGGSGADREYYNNNQSQASAAGAYLDMTRDLLNALQPHKTGGRDTDGYSKVDNREEDQFVELEYPTGIGHLFRILLKTDEKKVLALSNPDGYFYLFYIKTCIKFFTIVILFGGIVMSYICYKQNVETLSKSPLFQRMSLFDLISLPSTLFDQKVYYLALMYTFLISFLAYYILLEFCSEMSKFEFQPDQQIMDQFIQLHTVMIKGINTNLSPESAERGIGKVFSLRFGPKNILKIQLFRPTRSIDKIIKQRKNIKRKHNKVKKFNHHSDSRKMIGIGSALKCNKQMVDAENYYHDQIKELDSQIKHIRNLSKKQNLGFAFISFKDRECVSETLDEIELVKQNLMNDKKTIKLGIANWSVQPSYPPSDIIWSEIQNLGNSDGFLKMSVVYFSPIFLSMIIIYFINYLEIQTEGRSAINLVLSYFTTLFLAFFVLYLSPHLSYLMTEWENHERKSVKEESFLSKHSFMIGFNVIFSPFLSMLILVYFDMLETQQKALSNNKGTTTWQKVYEKSATSAQVFEFSIKDVSLQSLQNLEGFYTRYIMQIMLLCFLNQIFADFQKMVQIFEKVVVNGKQKFDHWFNDLSYKTTIIVGFFNIGLFFSIIYPHLTVLVWIILVFELYIDKYNLMFIYPLEFESQTISRKMLVKSSFYSVILFQTAMILIGLLRNSLLAPKTAVYLLAFVFIQFVVIIIIFEFMRRPWEGQEILLEKALEIQQNKILEDSISNYSFSEGNNEMEKLQNPSSSNTAQKVDEETGTIGDRGKQKSIISRDERQANQEMHEQVQQQRMNILMGAFNNPNEILLEDDIEHIIDKKEKEDEQNEAIFKEPVDVEVGEPNQQSNEFNVDEKGEFQIQNTNESSHTSSFQNILEQKDGGHNFDLGEPVMNDSDDFIVKKQEELQGQLNLTLIDEEPNHPGTALNGSIVRNNQQQETPQKRQEKSRFQQFEDLEEDYNNFD